MSGGFLATVAVVAALAAWYWASPWPVALAAVLVALEALALARRARAVSAFLWALTHPARPMQMHWSFSVILSERAWDTLGVPEDERPELQRLLGEYEPESLGREYLFEGHSTPVWVSRLIIVSYERWGESLERWTIENSWVRTALEPPAHHEKRVLEFVPALGETEQVVFGVAISGPASTTKMGACSFLTFDQKTTCRMGNFT